MYNEKDEQDSVLWQQFLSGNEDAYARIYEKHMQILFAYGMRFTSNRELVKDCIQELFIKIYTNRNNLGETNNIRLYLFIALKNGLFNVFKKEKEQFCLDTVEPVYDSEYNVEDLIIEDENTKEKQVKMIRILETMTPRQKEIIHYRFIEEMNLDEIAAIMEMNYQSVQNLLQRSIKRAKKLFVK